MAAVTLYRFRIELSDLDRNVYDTLDFRIAMHPSETNDYLLTRVFAYALNSDVTFAAEGLSDPDQPAMKRDGAHGAIDLWIEIGNPAARKLHRASKAARAVRVYTYKDPRTLVSDARDVPRAASIEVFAFPSAFLDELASRLERDCRWSVLVQDGLLTVSGDGFSVNGEMRLIPLVPN
jgi:uncharacterized protein YaeQ